jgi:hypothetical protein
MTEQLRVADLMSIEPISIEESAPVRLAQQLIDRHAVSGLPVVDAGGRLVGVISQTDLVRVHADEALRIQWTALRVSAVMSSPALTIDSTATVSEAAGDGAASCAPIGSRRRTAQADRRTVHVGPRARTRRTTPLGSWRVGMGYRITATFGGSPTS